MSAIRDGRYPVELDKERKLLFDLNVLDEVNDKFGGMEKLGEALQGKQGAKNLRWLVTLMLNEGKEDDEPALTERQVGKLVHAGNLVATRTAVMMAITVGNRGKIENEDESDEETDEGNGQTGKEK